MVDNASKSGKSKSPIADIFALVFFIPGAISWLVFSPYVVGFTGWALDPNKGKDTGYHVLLVLPLAGGLGLLGALIAIPLALLAEGLPRWLRIFTVLSPVFWVIFAIIQYIGLHIHP